MKKSAITFAILATLIFTVSVSAEKSTEDHIKALSSGSDLEKIEASRYLGDKKEKSAIPELINLLNRANDPKVAVPAGIALGQIGEAGDSTIALKNKVISSDNGDIVYTSLVSILNIVIKNEKAEDAAKEALEFADKNRRSDEFVSDFLNVLTKKLKG
ncbi:HEAT repeat domain-containing protein [Leptospira koniambonensis]|uniref:HEAT repeat domain-containing protein n=1 Tax=Leptospira koniambonensis TaxID=2484950 RepID=A0A4R9J7H5_9LEPT|nr:HEAT repeat domain-containing protein [Leptospira koniambonensis]TGL34713.1 HEAT repeat domain-containing protein [Leptospira koniambonensis]